MHDAQRVRARERRARSARDVERAPRLERALARSRSRRLVPSTYSSTRKNAPSSSLPKSVAAATFGCSMCAAAIASRSKRATTSGMPRHLGVQHLDRDPLAHEHVLGPVDRAHAALAEQPLDAVALGQDLAHEARAPEGTAGRGTDSDDVISGWTGRARSLAPKSNPAAS